MRFGSLFSGIGGLDLGLERAGMQCAWQVEIDPYARRVLEKHWPDVPRFTDVRGVHGEHPGDCLSDVDLIAGGFPCQDISLAGKGAGLAGARSGLWAEYRRILEEVQPTWVLIENVPALRSRGLDVVLRDLSALGYDAEWDGLSANRIGAPHRRDRLFIVAYSRGESLRLQQRGRGGQDGTGAFVFGRDGLERALAHTYRSWQLQQGGSVGQERGRAGDGCGPWAVEPDVGRVAYGVSSRVDRLKCLGNAVVPQVAEVLGRLIMDAANDR